MLEGVHRVRQRGSPPQKKHWIDNIKEDCGTLLMTIEQEFRTVQERNTWRTSINRLPLHAEALLGHRW